MPRKLKVAEVPKVEKETYICHCCLKSKNEDNFFTSKWSKVWNDKFCFVKIVFKP